MHLQAIRINKGRLIKWSLLFRTNVLMVVHLVHVNRFTKVDSIGFSVISNKYNKEKTLHVKE